MKQEVWLSSSAWQIEHLQVLFKFFLQTLFFFVFFLQTLFFLFFSPSIILFSPNIIFSHLKQLACQDLPATWKSSFKIFFWVVGCLINVLCFEPLPLEDEDEDDRVQLISVITT